MNRMKITTLLLLLVLSLGVIAFPLFAGCDVIQSDDTSITETSATVTTEEVSQSSVKTEKEKSKIDIDGYYYDRDSVILYLDTYGMLPPNYIKKSEAQALGWNGGSVERYQEGAAIGGDRFGNYEKLLPSGGSYTECDLDTDGGKSRGAKRLIFSSDGRYYYTADHYEHFTEYVVNGGKVEPK